MFGRNAQNLDYTSFLNWRHETQKLLLARQQQQGWGAKVIERLAKDLKAAFSDMNGFSARNLKYMRAFAEAYPDELFVSYCMTNSLVS